MSAPVPHRYRVVVVEWLSHVAVIEAASPEQAEALGRELWNEHGSEIFEFEDQDFASITADKLPE